MDENLFHQFFNGHVTEAEKRRDRRETWMVVGLLSLGVGMSGALLSLVI